MLGNGGLACFKLLDQFPHCFVPLAEGYQNVTPGCLSNDGKYVVCHHALHTSDIYARWHPRIVPLVPAAQARARTQSNQGSSPCRGNTSLRVAMMVRSTSSLGSKPTSQDRHQRSDVVAHRLGGLHAEPGAVLVSDVVAPVLRNRGAQRHRAAGGDGYEVAPGPRHHADHVVAAAPGGNPPVLAVARGEVADGRGGLALAVHADVQVGERVKPVRVAAVLADDHFRFERANELGHDGVEGPQPPGVNGAGREGDVHGAALRVRSADLVGKPGAREEGQPGFVQRNGQDARIVPEDALRAVAVVRIDVDVGHPPDAAVEQPLDREGGVVVDAKTARALPGGVVHPAAEVHGPHGAAVQDSCGRQQGAAGQPGAGFVHAGKGGVVLGSETPGVVGGVRVFAHAPHGGHKLRAVDRAQLRVGGDVRSRYRDVVQIQQSKAAGQLRCELHALRRHRVGVAKVVGSHGWGPHHRRWQRGLSESGQECHQSQATRAVPGFPRAHGRSPGHYPVFSGLLLGEEVSTEEEHDAKPVEVHEPGQLAARHAGAGRPVDLHTPARLH